MTTHTIRKGFDIRLAGAAEPRVETAPEPLLVGLQPREFLGIKPKLLVDEGDRVRTGQPVLRDKSRPGLELASPATGKVTRVVLGSRRFPERIEITPEEKDEFAELPTLAPERLASASREDVIEGLHGAGLWPLLKQRPVGKIADRSKIPVAVFLNGMDTEPLAADPGLLVRGRGESLQLGVHVLRRLTEGPVYLTVPARGEPAPELRNLDGVEVHRFAGPHPSGLVGTHIQEIRPLKSGEVAWCLRVQDAAAIGDWVATGRYPTHTTVATAGTGAPAKRYFEVRRGSALLTVTGGKPLEGDWRMINGTVLSGLATEPLGFLGFYANTLTVIPEGRERRDLFGWMLPKFDKLSASRAVLSWLTPKDEYELDARVHGGPRNIVNIGLWEQMTPLDIHPTYLVRAIQAGDLEQAIQLGLLEVTEEDMALITFADPCKIEVGDIVRQGLDLYEREG